MEAEALDVGAVLLGDVALLVMAPLVIYAALKMIWEEQFEDGEEEGEEESGGEGYISPGKKQKNVALKASSADLESSLKDPVLKEIATTAARNIMNAAKDASDSCFFDASLEELAVKHGGREPSQKWIESLLRKQKSGVIRLTDKQMKEAESMSPDELCLWLSKLRAERTAMAEIRKLIKLLIDRHRS